jgi:hypothetical protein
LLWTHITDEGKEHGKNNSMGMAKG